MRQFSGFASPYVDHACDRGREPYNASQPKGIRAVSPIALTTFLRLGVSKNRQKQPRVVLRNSRSELVLAGTLGARAGQVIFGDIEIPSGTYDELWTFYPRGPTVIAHDMCRGSGTV